MTPIDAPPPVIDMARVIAYAVVDDSVKWTGRQTIFVRGKELGPVPRLALAQNIEGDLKDVLIFHCNDTWEVLGVSAGATIEEAKSRAERAYRGIGAKWIDTHISVAEAKAWIEENYDHIFCMFCGRTPDDFHALVEGKLATICDLCIDELHQELHQSGDVGGA